MNECSPKLETGNKYDFFAFVQDTGKYGKYLVWLLTGAFMDGFTKSESWRP